MWRQKCMVFFVMVMVFLDACWMKTAKTWCFEMIRLLILLCTLHFFTLISVVSAWLTACHESPTFSDSCMYIISFLWQLIKQLVLLWQSRSCMYSRVCAHPECHPGSPSANRNLLWDLNASLVNKMADSTWHVVSISTLKNCKFHLTIFQATNYGLWHNFPIYM